MYPIPMELPRFTEEQKRFSEYLRSAVLVHNIFMPQQAFSEIIRQATIDNSGNKSTQPIIIQYNWFTIVLSPCCFCQWVPITRRLDQNPCITNLMSRAQRKRLNDLILFTIDRRHKEHQQRCRWQRLQKVDSCTKVRAISYLKQKKLRNEWVMIPQQ